MTCDLLLSREEEGDLAGDPGVEGLPGVLSGAVVACREEEAWEGRPGHEGVAGDRRVHVEGEAGLSLEGDLQESKGIRLLY
jgi:hypothetical protein